MNLRTKYQAYLLSKADFDNEFISFNRKIISNKTKEIKEKINSLITKYYNFFFGRTYFICNDGSWKTFLYKPTLDTLELKKDKCWLCS